MNRRQACTTLLTLFSSPAFVTAKEPASGNTTRLTRRGPAPQPYDEIRENARLRKIEYQSDNLRLKAWLATPRNPNKLPIAVVFLHGGFSLGEEDMADAQSFLDAGYPVLFPALRAENGNPGDFELMRGEVADALAAANWLARHNGGSRSKIVVFGHSVGGGVAELISLRESDSIILSGSVGALYPPDVFLEWDFVPFDATDAKEVIPRTFISNLGAMKRRHVAYLGEADTGAQHLAQYRALATRAKAPLTVHSVPGDHHSSVRPAILAFLKEIQRQELGK